MNEEAPYVPDPVVGPEGRPLPQSQLPAPTLDYARPMGAWVIVGILFVIVVGLWAYVAAYFTSHA